MKSISTGKSSSLPASISNIRTHLEKGLNRLKFWVGPTSSNPGPMLLKVAATAVKFVVKSYPSMLMAKTDKKNSTKYTEINALVERSVS